VTSPMDMSKDPDRYDPARDSAEPVFDPADHPAIAEPLDPAKDPDRFRGQDLTDLLGPGAQVEDRDGYQWVAGLVGVMLFLALVAFLFSEVLTP
jgi:hypothetical protein